MKILTKLLFIFIAITAIPLVFIATLAFVNAKGALSDSVINDLSHISDFKSREIDGYFNTLKNDLYIAQGYYNFKKNIPIVSRLADKKTSPEYLESKRQLDDQFRVLQKVKGFVNIILVDSSGKNVYSSDLDRMGAVERSVRDFNPEAVGQGREDIYFSDPFEYPEEYQREGYRFGMLAVTPVHDLDGKRVGEAVFEINLDPIYKSIQEITGLGETGETLIGKKINDKEALILNPLRHDKDAALKKKISIGDDVGIAIQRAAQGMSGSGTIIDYRGMEVLADWHFIPSLNWGIVVKIDAEEAFSPINNLKNIIVLVGLVEFFSLMLVIISAAKSISDPIKKLHQGADIIAGGDLNYKMDATLASSADEVGQLSRAFNKMTEKLKESYAGLEQKVRERTSDLQISETRYRRLFEAAKDGILILNVDTGAITDVNPYLINMLGYPIEELIGKKIWEISPFKDIAENKNAFDRLKQQEYVRYEGLPLQTKDGHSMQVEFVSNVYMAGDRQVIQCNVRDITERKRAENALREKTEDLRKFELAVENAYSHVVITDPDGVILYANKAAEKITGYSKKEILGQRPSLWGKQMDFEFYQNLWRTIKEDKKTFGGEVKNRRKSGEIYFADVHISPVLGENGEVKFFVGIERDITEEKKLEKAHTDFLSLASHQLRTPLSGIKWQIETMKKGIIGRFTEKQETYINGIYEANERMIKLVFDMLNVLKFESGFVKIKKEEITFAAIFNSIMAYIGPAAKSKGISIRVAGDLSKDYGAIIIETDFELLRLILENFFSNAVDYSKEEGEIIFDVVEEEGNIVFSVKDFGIGIPKDEQRKIFERFYRAGNAKIVKPSGTGLGLYVSAMLAEKIRGAVSFKSEEGKETTFYLRVPKK